MKTGIVIQARMGSTRLPGKVLMPVGSLPLIVYLSNRLGETGIPVMVATTDQPADDELVKVLESHGIPFYRGSEQNVLSRYIASGIRERWTHLVRICSDNPFIDVPALKRLIGIAGINPSSDYVSYSYKGTPTILTHFGFFGEIVRLSALQEIERAYSDREGFCEHVTKGVYTMPEHFSLKLEPIDEEVAPYEGIRCTIDTQEDYYNIQQIMNSEEYREGMSLQQLGDLILHMPGMLTGMNETILKNRK